MVAWQATTSIQGPNHAYSLSIEYKGRIRVNVKADKNLTVGVWGDSGKTKPKPKPKPKPNHHWECMESKHHRAVDHRRQNCPMDIFATNHLKRLSSPPCSTTWEKQGVSSVLCRARTAMIIAIQPQLTPKAAYSPPTPTNAPFVIIVVQHMVLAHLRIVIIDHTIIPAIARPLD